ncbi:hypothetical protein AAFF_G00358180 [Aldrovandia affinis]|uniref:LRP2-binding protein n=1 Tax=Aldrovandia affinis TaxID=143900 RepID=A0AAD7T8X5_9TELE|nr:hypothetical protein AAFF_G00358180 [Aldrovandia affinis]
MESNFETHSREDLKSGRLINTISKVYGELTLTPENETEIESDTIVLKTFDTKAADNGSLVEKTEKFLKERAEGGDEQAIFLLGQLYYEEGLFAKAGEVFDSIKETDPKALYQLAVMYFHGLGTTVNNTTAVEYMKRVASCDSSEAASVKHCALYNLGTACLEGYGVPTSREEAERYWLLAAGEGNTDGNVKAQTSLGLFYSNPETLDLTKAFHWHSEACGNGSLESQGALGVMYLYGMGTRQDYQSALLCLMEASERGNVYAQGHLVGYYYYRKLFSKAAILAKRLSKQGEEDIAAIAKSTECLPEYISKGIAMAIFYYARCLQLGKGVPQDLEEAKRYYSKAARLNPEVCKELHMDLTYGKI